MASADWVVIGLTVLDDTMGSMRDVVWTDVVQMWPRASTASDHSSTARSWPPACR